MVAIPKVRFWGKKDKKPFQKFQKIKQKFQKGLWAILFCLGASMLEVLLGLQSFTVCMHYDDVVERLQLYNELSHLAEIYPGYPY